MPSRSPLNLIVEKEYSHDWHELLNLLLSSITSLDLDSWRTEIADIASSLDKPECLSGGKAISEKRLKLQLQIEKLQYQMSALENDS